MEEIKQAQAIAKMQRISPIKARLVVDMIRGKKVNEALAILSNTNKKAAVMVKNTLNSDIANATNNHDMKLENLYVSEARVDAGPVMKRILFDSRGRIGHTDKRTSHIVIKVAEK